MYKTVRRNKGPTKLTVQEYCCGNLFNYFDVCKYIYFYKKILNMLYFTECVFRIVLYYLITANERDQQF